MTALASLQKPKTNQIINPLQLLNFCNKGITSIKYFCFFRRKFSTTIPSWKRVTNVPCQQKPFQVYVHVILLYSNLYDNHIKIHWMPLNFDFSHLTMLKSSSQWKILGFSRYVVAIYGKKKVQWYGWGSSH